MDGMHVQGMSTVCDNTRECMHYTSVNTRRTARTIPLVCGLLFAAFSFLYLYFLQPDLLALLQFRLSDGQTSYDPLIGSLLITLVLTLLGAGLQRLLSLPIRALVLAWLPSCLLLLALIGWCIVPEEGDAICLPPMPRLIFLAVLAVAYLIALRLCYVYRDTAGERASLVSHYTPNLLVLGFAFSLVGAVGNTSTPLHYELQVERLLSAGRYAEALQVGEQAETTSPRLTAMRCYALSREGQLGERLFTYALHGDCTQMLPEWDATVRTHDLADSVYRHLRFRPCHVCRPSAMLFLENAHSLDTLASPVLRDYLLSACLLERRLSRFAEIVVADSVKPLPTHYREALALYATQDTCFQQPHPDTQTEQALHDFLTEMEQADGDASPEDRLRHRFSHTYWYYYFFAK